MQWASNPAVGSFIENKVVVADVIPAESPDRAECAILGKALDIFGQFRLLLWLESHFVIWEFASPIPS